MRRISAALAAAAVVALGVATAQAGAADIDYSQVARNIIPSGQQGSLPIPSDATAQAQMYNALTPLFDHVTNADVFTDFKSEQFGLRQRRARDDRAGPAIPGVTIVRDRFHVPHVRPPPTPAASGPPAGSPPRTAGCCSRRRATTRYVAAIDAPGLTRDRPDREPPELPAQRPDRAGRRPPDPGAAEGRSRGPRRAADIDEFITGINAYLKIHSPTEAPCTRSDIYALQRAQGPVLRRGRRQRSPELRVPGRARAAGSGSTRATASSTTCARTSTPAARRPSTARSTTTTRRRKPGAPGQRRC